MKSLTSCRSHLATGNKVYRVNESQVTARIIPSEKAPVAFKLKTARSLKYKMYNMSSSSERKDAVTRVENIEKELDSKLSELKRSQDALRKAISARQKLLDTLDANRSGSPSTSTSLEDENSSVEDVSSGDEA